MNTDIVTTELIASKIYVIRGVKVMLDRDLAVLYEVQTKALKHRLSGATFKDSPKISCLNSAKKSLPIGGHNL
jgi:hypothetical protein